MNLSFGPSRRSRPRKLMTGSKNNVLTDDEFLHMLESDTLLSSEEEFVGDSVNDYLANDNENDKITNSDDEDKVDISDVLTNFTPIWLTDPPNVNRIEYTALPGLKFLPDSDKPIDYFNFLFTDELLDLLVKKTNAYSLEIFFKTSHQNNIELHQY
ncbi:Hypothetical protein CINCED_3A018309 [Cinara cedri]|uniref:PiggyBac transposable element-derived protein n=1 Tax=Cinara cedri TaxID=506608 RepID=A0A5E4NR35_9HEMI|nr:Hypothetical protein CINCED_3A018309 [Cinara cedri]